MRESSGVEDSTDTGVKATGEAAKRRGGLYNEVGVGIEVGEGCRDGGDGSELDV